MSISADQLINEASLAKREGRFGQARNALLKAVSLLRQEDTSAALARALRSLGEVERKLHDTSSAQVHYEESVAIYRRSGDALALAHTVRHLGDILHEAGDAASAKPCYNEALALYRAHPEASPLDVANAIRSMAVLKADVGSTEEARQLWEEARSLYAMLNIAEGVRESSARLARLGP